MINKKRMLEEFKRLASFDSESFHEREISIYLMEKLKSLGLEVSIDTVGHQIMENEDATGNIYAFLKGNSDMEPVFFSAHMDTVAPGKGKKVIYKDGIVTSDGTTVLGSDDLTGVVSILETLEVIQERNLPHPDIEVIFFVAEEAYGWGSLLFDYSKIKAKQGYVLDLTGKVGTAALVAPTIFQYKFEVYGKTAHAGFSIEEGISAISIASKAISRLRIGRIDPETTANVGLISGGTGKNVVPGMVQVEGEIRSTDNDKVVELFEEYRKIFEEEALKMNGFVKVQTMEMIRAYRLTEDSKTARSYRDTMHKLGMGEPTFITTFGGSDANGFNKHGIECLVIANAMMNVHTTSEYFEFDEFVKSTKITLDLATK